MHKTIDKRKTADIKVSDLHVKDSFTLIGSNEVLVVMDVNQEYNKYAKCFNISKSSSVQIENHLPVCPCDVEITILDKEVKNDGIKA